MVLRQAPSVVRGLSWLTVPGGLPVLHATAPVDHGTGAEHDQDALVLHRATFGASILSAWQEKEKQVQVQLPPP